MSCPSFTLMVVALRVICLRSRVNHRMPCHTCQCHVSLDTPSTWQYPVTALLVPAYCSYNCQTGFSMSNTPLYESTDVVSFPSLPFQLIFLCTLGNGASFYYISVSISSSFLFLHPQSWCILPYLSFAVWLASVVPLSLYLTFLMLLVGGIPLIFSPGHGLVCLILDVVGVGVGV